MITLTEYFTDVANAIRSKTGKSNKITGRYLPRYELYYLESSILSLTGIKKPEVDYYQSNLSKLFTDISKLIKYFLNDNTKIKALDFPSKIESIVVLRSQHSSATLIDLNNYMIFAGGSDYIDGSFTKHDSVYVCDENLTMRQITSLTDAKTYMGKAKLGNNILLAGGLCNSEYSIKCDSYNDSLTKNELEDLSERSNSKFGAYTDNYALFSGGWTGSDKKFIDVYNKSLSKENNLNLTEVKQKCDSASFNNYSMFIGGWTNTTYSVLIDAFNNSLTKIAITNLSKGRGSSSSSVVGNYLMIAGGNCYDENKNNEDIDTIEVYDSNLQKLNDQYLSSKRHSPTSCSYKNYALFSGYVLDVYNDNLTKEYSVSFSSKYDASSVNNYAMFSTSLSDALISMVQI